MELFISHLNNGEIVYSIGIDEPECRDNINEYIKERYFSNGNIIIKSIELVA